MKRVVAGAVLVILFSMVLGVGLTGCVGSGYKADKDRCSERSSRSTGTRLTRYTCREGVDNFEYDGNRIEPERGERG